MDIDTIEPHPLVHAKTVAREAGAILLSGFCHVRQLEFKGSIDLVTEYDKESEKHIVQYLQKTYPEHNILTEECGAIYNNPNCDFEWIIDPLDGTSNFVHGYPVFAVSIALAYLGNIIISVIYDPVRGEMFSAQVGKSSTLNGNITRVSNTQALEFSMLATGFPYDIRTNKQNNLDHFSHMILRCQEIRRSGSASLDLAWTSCGRLDGFWEIGLQPWDIAAGSLLVQEAGGRVTDHTGGNQWLELGNILASNRFIHGEILAVLSKGEHAPFPER